MSKKPKLLFTCPRTPFPPIGGDRTWNYYLIPELHKYFDLTLACTGSGFLSDKGRFYLQQFGSLHFWHKRKISFLRNVMAWPRRIPMPLQVSLYYFKDVADRIRELANSHDAILCNTIRTAPYADDLKIPKFCDIGDNNGAYYKNLQQSQGLSLISLYSMIDQPYIERYEKSIIEEFDHSFLFNPEEMSAYNCQSKLTRIPLGVNPRLIERSPTSDENFRSTIVFFGKMSSLPNITAVEWFAINVMPLLPEGVQFAIIGPDPPKRIRSLANQRIRVLGFVEDPYPAIRGALAVVAPMRLGRGIQNKVLEAMAVGGLCILTSSPAKALANATNGQELLIADEPETYAELIKVIVADPRAFDSVRSAARRFIAEYHSWERTGRIYVNALKARLSLT